MCGSGLGSPLTQIARVCAFGILYTRATSHTRERLAKLQASFNCLKGKKETAQSRAGSFLRKPSLEPVSLIPLSCNSLLRLRRIGPRCALGPIHRAARKPKLFMDCLGSPNSGFAAPLLAVAPRKCHGGVIQFYRRVTSQSRERCGKLPGKTTQKTIQIV